jgi:hypothetical protein
MPHYVNYLTAECSVDSSRNKSFITTELMHISNKDKNQNVLEKLANQSRGL